MIRTRALWQTFCQSALGDRKGTKHASFDLLIGADGIHSNVRQLVFGDNSRDDAQFEHYLGYSFASYPLVDRYGIGHTWKNYSEPGRLASAYCGEEDGELITFLMYKTAHEGYVPREKRLPRLRRSTAEWDGSQSS